MAISYKWAKKFENAKDDAIFDATHHIFVFSPSREVEGVQGGGCGNLPYLDGAT
jgi:hypothetical protein